MRTWTRVTTLVYLALAVVVGLLTGKALGDNTNEAGAATAINLVKLYIREDSFYNYDFNEGGQDWNNVDWTMNMLFWNNAEVNKIKDILYPEFPNWGGAKYQALDDGAGEWGDSDSGVKSRPACPFYGASAYHMRIYADQSTDRMYNVDWGYYVIGSTHEDYQECTHDPQHGWTEWVETYFADYLRYLGYAVAEDWGWWYNREPPFWEGNHYWDNNGYTTATNIP